MPLTASDDGTARVRQSDSGKLVAELRGHTGFVYAASFGSDGSRNVAASSDKTARVWQSDTGKLVAELQGHTGEVNAASFSGDGSRIVTASDDNSAGLWSAVGEPLRFFGRGEATRRAVVLKRDGAEVAQVWDEVALRWRDTRTVLWQALDFCLSPEERSERLLESAEQAREGHRLCRETVAACRKSSFEACDRVVQKNYAPLE